MPELLLALDAGTTTIRACLFTAAGDLLRVASRPVVTRSPLPGRVEQDASEIWAQARAVAAEALDGRSLGEVAGIGVTSQRASAVIWDRRTGEPLSPLVVWSDLRGRARAAELQALGFPLSPQQAATKLEAMLAEVRRTAPAADLAFGNIDSYLVFRLTGVHATDRSQAWPSGYVDLASLGWNTRLLEAQGLDPALFPALVDTWGPIGDARIEGLSGTSLLCAIIADQQAAQIGHGAEARGQIKATLGTSATVSLSTGTEFMWRGGTIPPFIQDSVAGQTRFCLEGMVNTAGAAVDWLRRTFSLGDQVQFAALLEGSPDSGGVAFLPALQGLGAPYGDLTRRGGLTGLSLASTPEHVARAGVEGVAFRVREVFDHLLAQTGTAVPDTLRVDGGLTGSDGLMQALADSLARPVERHGHREATSAWAAVCAARGAGLLSAAETAGFARFDRTYQPRTTGQEAADRLAAWRARVLPDLS